MAAVIKDRQFFNSEFLKAVRQTISNLEFRDKGLSKLTEDCTTAEQWTDRVKINYATEQELTIYNSLFKHTEEKPDIQCDKSVAFYYTNLKNNARTLLNAMKHRDERVDGLGSIFEFGLGPKKEVHTYRVIRYIYEKEPFVLMELQDQKKKDERSVWVRYNIETKYYEETKQNLTDYVDYHDVPTEITHKTAVSKISNKSKNTKVNLEATVNAHQATVPEKKLESSEKTPTEATTTGADNRDSTTTIFQAGDQDWDVINDIVDFFEDDMVLVTKNRGIIRQKM